MAEYLKIPEVAQRLDVSEKTARRYVKAGELPSVFIGGAYRVSEEDLEKYLEAARVGPGDGSGKAPPPLPHESEVVGSDTRHQKEQAQQRLAAAFGAARGEEDLLQYLQAWRAFIWRLEHRWTQEPPASRREVAVVLDVMQSLTDEGVFARKSDVGWLERDLLLKGIEALNRIADDVEADEEAERRRSTFREIKDRMAETA